MKLNITQRTILTIGSVLILLLVLFPPTYYYGYTHTGEQIKVFSGYRFIGTLEITGQEPVGPLDPRTAYQMGVRPDKPTQEEIDTYLAESDSLVQELMAMHKEPESFDIIIKSALNPKVHTEASVYNIEPVRLSFLMIGTVLAGLFLVLAFSSISDSSK